jgi:hypothetical protein
MPRDDGMCQCVREGLAEPWHHSPTCPDSRTPAKLPVDHSTFQSELSLGGALAISVGWLPALYIADFLFGRWW